MPFSAASRRRHGARPRDEVHWRGHGIARNFPAAFAKTQLAISYAPPEGGTVFVSVCDRDKRATVPIARDIARLGCIVATGGNGPHVAGGRRSASR